MKSPKCVICPSSPAGKIDLTVDNGKRRFKRLRHRKRLCPIAQRLSLVRFVKSQKRGMIGIGRHKLSHRIERRRHGYDDRTDIC